jgi:hypothetical protein
MFQQPLYVGKAIDLQRRIKQHLQTKSDLRSRLDEAKIELDRCRLLIVFVDRSALNELPILDAASVADGAEDEQPDALALELVMEELFSKLFLPSFTQRYG